LRTGRNISRWLALLPASIIGAVVTYHLIGALNRITMWGVGIDSNSFLAHLYTDFITHAAYGFVFVLVATIVAPSLQKQVGFVMAGFIAICTISLICFDTIDGKYGEILGDISTLLGAGGITLEMWTTQNWGRGFLHRGSEDLCSAPSHVSPSAPK
jgi:hypothetical protein